jgi:hypothetical protein
MVIGVTSLPFLGLGAIISLDSRVQLNKMVYQITISHFLEYICPNFLNMVVASVGRQRQYVNYTSITSFFTFER